ncbi:MAG: hypothetical protein HC888_07875 [Candidatus Competibacteraceae bacterium]|nr:hypothetical protein [Candidatus Competibacteraceae bacterium]
MSSSECNGATPLCENGDCVACGDATGVSCADDYPDTPVCDVAGACVECTVDDVSACPAEMPACVGNVCVPCTEHEQCPESACEIELGSCMPTDRVWHVDGDTVNCGTADGSESAPFCTITAAIAQITDGAKGTLILHELDNDQTYDESATIGAATVIAFLAADGEFPVWRGGAGNALRADEGASIYVHRISFRSASSSAMVVTLGGHISVSRCTVAKSIDHGILISGGSISLVNSFVSVDALDASAVNLDQGTLNAVYSTLSASAIGAPALSCTNGGTGSQIRNSLIVSLDPNSPEVSACNSATVVDSATETMLGDNVALGSMMASWFTSFNSGDLHLTGSAPAAISDAAVWRNGDPATDIDGQPRPNADGTADFTGADIP